MAYNGSSFKDYFDAGYKKGNTLAAYPGLVQKTVENSNNLQMEKMRVQGAQGIAQTKGAIDYRNNQDTIASNQKINQDRNQTSRDNNTATNKQSATNNKNDQEQQNMRHQQTIDQQNRQMAQVAAERAATLKLSIMDRISKNTGLQDYIQKKIMDSDPTAKTWWGSPNAKAKQLDAMVKTYIEINPDIAQVMIQSQQQSQPLGNPTAGEQQPQQPRQPSAQPPQDQAQQGGGMDEEQAAQVTLNRLKMKHGPSVVDPIVQEAIANNRDGSYTELMDYVLEHLLNQTPPSSQQPSAPSNNTVNTAPPDKPSRLRL